jgi:hypothetical protein
MGVINAQKHIFRQISKAQRMPETTVVFFNFGDASVVLHRLKIHMAAKSFREDMG